VFYEKGKYAEAYFLFKDLKEQVLKFSKLLSELYFMTFSNLESSFFKLLELYQMDKELFVSMIDIKNLKSFNTIYGELVITKALKKLEKKLEKFISKDKKRVLIIKGITSDFYVLNVDYTKEEYERFLDKIRALVSEVIEIDNLKIEFLSTLVGIKIDKYSDYREYEFVKILTFLNNRAKKAKKNVFTVFDESNNSLFASILNEKYNEKFLLSKIKSKEIDIVFQPIFKSDGKKYFTLEVLGRIKDDEKLLPAGMFIDKIYEMNLIEKFDMLILEKLIEKKEFIKKISDSVFVNVSFQSLLNEEYMYKLKELLENKDLNVILELTEQKFVENLELVKEIHKKYGVFFAVDDFGSGYSSLQTVIELVKEKVLKILKIDGSLIRNVQNDEYMKKIVKIISRLGNELELKTVAEFVENEETFNLLKDIKIDLFQGYFLCMPKSLEELLAVKSGALEF
jgi:EAL domain-containing protein (putative c-di-GMP-specific phosphodiesterase class I)/GGDEF domain-containing protein